MDIEHMVKMVNEISLFFEGESGAGEEAARSVANHLRRFWDPRMRKQIIAHYNKGGAGLEDVGLAGVAILAKDGGTGAPTDIKELGEGSDAG
jgi:formate dehydrogenase subunit delta